MYTLRQDLELLTSTSAQANGLIRSTRSERWVLRTSFYLRDHRPQSEVRVAVFREVADRAAESLPMTYIKPVFSRRLPQMESQTVRLRAATSVHHPAKFATVLQSLRLTCITLVKRKLYTLPRCVEYLKMRPRIVGHQLPVSRLDLIRPTLAASNLRTTVQLICLFPPIAAEAERVDIRDSPARYLKTATIPHRLHHPRLHPLACIVSRLHKVSIGR